MSIATLDTKATSHGVGNDTATAQLRILATTDIHMQLRGFDYVADSPGTTNGLISIASLIDQARTEALQQNRGCVLFDNGDLFQGTPMGDHLAHLPVTRDHPAIACINHLEYAALGVGNHDLDFGLPYLQCLTSQLDMPVVTSNLQSADFAPLQDACIIDCKIPIAQQGNDPKVVRIGVLSVLPQQTAVWNHHWLQDRASVTPAIQCLLSAVPALRAKGADLVVVLAHMGIADDGEDPDDTALALANIPGIDAMIAGHTHRRFPGNDHRHVSGVDPAQGKLMQVPAIMPGHGGSDLGVLDLTLERDAQGKWRVIGHVCGLRENTPSTLLSPTLIAATTPAHETLRRQLSAPMGHTDTHLHNYFSLAAPTPSAGFAAYAKARAVCQALAGTPDAALPLLSTAASHTAGGREGPDHYISIPKGLVLRRHLAGLNPYNNQVCAMRITGQELRNWLEHAAMVFAQQTDTQLDATLLCTQTPIFNFETVYGVTYKIDPTQPKGMRIGSLLWDGTPVQPNQMFMLATNQFRAAGGGGFDRLPLDRFALRLTGNTAPMYADALGSPHMPLWESATPWQFATPMPITTELRTSPLAINFFDEIAHLEPQSAGLDDKGFLRVHLTL